MKEKWEVEGEEWKKRGKSCTQNIDVGDVLANYRDTQQSQAEDKRPCAPYKVQSIIKSHPNACFEEGSKKRWTSVTVNFNLGIRYLVL